MPRGGNPAARESANDPLAELARLIGQGDPYGDAARFTARSYDSAEPAGADWAADEPYHDEIDSQGDARYGAPPLYDPYPSEVEEDRGEERAGANRFFSGPAPQFNGFHADSVGEPSLEEAHDRHEPPPLSPASQPISLASAAPDDRARGYESDPAGAQAYVPEDYYEDSPSPGRRGGVTVVIAVLGVVVLGTAGAFAYRAMFGGTLLPTLPPIIKASTGPNKIVPTSGDSHAGGSTDSATGGVGEQLASHEEQPVDMQGTPKAAPRIVSTIPIGASPQNPAMPGTPGAAPPSFAPVPEPTTPTVGGLVPPPAPGAPAPEPVAPAAPAPTASPSVPKKVHTVTIRADQPGGRGVSPVQSVPARGAGRAAPPSRSGANEPLSLAPGAQSEPVPPSYHGAAPAPPPRARAPMTVASAEGGSAAGATTAASGGYAVQVTSQRSAAEAHSAFRSLRAKYPNQLGNREPIIRRANLGPKGTYYRAMVGPFASIEEASGMCSSLKAAGGNCIVQRN